LKLDFQSETANEMNQNKYMGMNWTWNRWQNFGKSIVEIDKIEPKLKKTKIEIAIEMKSRI